MKPISPLTHFDEHGQAHMVDVGQKSDTLRIAQAHGHIRMSVLAFEQLNPELNPKGDVLSVARIAAIQACKQTSNLIPLCHPLSLTRVAVEFELDEIEHAVSINVTAQTMGKTGVEMEALTGVSVGLLTIYDMLKAVDKSMVMGGVELLHKHGGKSGTYVNPRYVDTDISPLGL